jgi:hypothetical protein
LIVPLQVIDNMFHWEARGVNGVVNGTAFMGGDWLPPRGARENPLTKPAPYSALSLIPLGRKSKRHTWARPSLLTQIKVVTLKDLS